MSKTLKSFAIFCFSVKKNLKFCPLGLLLHIANFLICINLSWKHVDVLDEVFS